MLSVLPACAQLAPENPGEVLSECLPLLRDSHAPELHRWFAIWRLKGIGNLAAEAGPALVELLGDERFSDAAAEAIHALGAAEVETFLEGLKSTSERVRWICARELLLTRVELADVADRRAFVRMVAEMDLEQAAAVLGAAAADPDETTRQIALAALDRSKDRELRWLVDRVLEPGDTDLAISVARFSDEPVNEAAQRAVVAWLARKQINVERGLTREEIAAADEAASRQRDALLEFERRQLVLRNWIELGEAGPRAVARVAGMLAAWWELCLEAPNRAEESLKSRIMELEEGNVRERLRALQRLAMMPIVAGPAYSYVEHRVRDEDSAVRHLAARLLGTREAQRTADMGDLVERLQSERAEPRVEAVRRIQQEGFINADTAKVMSAAVGSEDWLKRAGFVAAAQRAWSSEKSIGAALDELEVSEVDALDRMAVGAAKRMLAAGAATNEVIAPLRTAVIKSLRGQMRSKEPATLRRGLRAARQLGLVCEMCAETEAAALSEDRELRAEATVALVSLGEGGVPGLVAMLESDDVEKRGLALSQLGSMGVAAKSALGPIRTLGKDQNESIAMLAQMALRQIDPPRVDAQGAGNASLRFNARQREEARGALVDLRNDSSAARQAAAIRLDREEVLEKRISNALIKAVISGDFAAREGLVMGIERAWKEEIGVEAALKQIATEEDPTKRAFAKAALRAIAPPNQQ